jgi:serine/threonine-protein kinase
VFGQGPGGILAVSANGGKPEPWGRADPAEMAASPYLLPDGRSLLFTVTPMSQAADRWNRADIVVQPRGGERRVLVRGGGDARYLPTGHIVYAVGTNVLVAPFDLQRLELTGDAVPLVEGVARAVNPGTTTAAAQFDVASDGTLVYVPAASVMGANGQRSLALVDRDGRVEPLALPPSSYQKPRLSPDGTQLAVGTFDEDGNNLWIYDLAKKGALRRLTFDGNSNSPIWSADGRHVVFASTRDGRLGLFRQAVDGTGAAVRLSTVAVGEEVVDPTAWSRDGRTVVFDVLKNGDWGVATLSAEAGGAARPLVDVSGSIERGGEISPDGRWMAYLTETGTTGLEHAFVEPFPPTGAKYQVSRAHAHGLTWSPDGREIVYFDAESRRFTAVPVQTQPSFSAGVPMPLPIASVPLLTESSMDRHYDFTPDGKRLLMLIPASTGTSERSAMQQITVVLNWFEELRQRTSSR